MLDTYRPRSNSRAVSLSRNQRHCRCATDGPIDDDLREAENRRRISFTAVSANRGMGRHCVDGRGIAGLFGQRGAPGSAPLTALGGATRLRAAHIHSSTIAALHEPRQFLTGCSPSLMALGWK